MSESNGHPGYLHRWLWSYSEVGDLLGKSEDAVKDLYRVGQLRGVKVGKTIRFKPDHVREFVDSLQPVEK